MLTMRAWWGVRALAADAHDAARWGALAMMGRCLRALAADAHDARLVRSERGFLWLRLLMLMMHAWWGSVDEGLGC